QEIAMPDRRGVDALAVDIGSLLAVQIARGQAVGADHQHAMRRVDAVDVEPNVAARTAADERRGHAERPSRSRLSSVLQDQFAHDGGLIFARLVGVHANTLDYRTSIVSIPSSAKMGVMIE